MICAKLCPLVVVLAVAVVGATGASEETATTEESTKAYTWNDGHLKLAYGMAIVPNDLEPLGLSDPTINPKLS